MGQRSALVDRSRSRKALRTTPFSASISRSRLALGTPEPLGKPENLRPVVGAHLQQGPEACWSLQIASYLRSKKLSSIRKTHPYRRILPVRSLRLSSF